MNKITFGFMVGMSVVAFGLGGCAEVDDAGGEEAAIGQADEALVAGDLLRNGNFQQGLAHWQVRAGKEKGEAEINTDLPCDGQDPKCPEHLALAGGTVEKSWASQTVVAQAGGTYLLRFKAATGSSQQDPGLRALVEFLDADGKEIGQKTARVEVDPRAWTCFDCTPSGTAWKKNDLRFTTPARTASVRVKFVANADPPDYACFGSGAHRRCIPVWGKIDNVSLTRP